MSLILLRLLEPIFLPKPDEIGVLEFCLDAFVSQSYSCVWGALICRQTINVDRPRAFKEPLKSSCTNSRSTLLINLHYTLVNVSETGPARMLRGNKHVYQGEKARGCRCLALTEESEKNVSFSMYEAVVLKKSAKKLLTCCS